MFVFLFLMLQFPGVTTNDMLIDARENFLTIETIEAAELKEALWLADENPVVQGYGACMYFMQAKLVKNPITKWSRFKKGKKVLEKLIENNPNNIELRYQRFLFQSEMPEFLGYHENKKDDYEFILSTIDQASLEADFKCKMLENISKLKSLEPDQKLTVNKKVEACS